MTKEEIDKLKDNKEIKFIYKVPCSFYPERFEYIIIGDNFEVTSNNYRSFTMEDWFKRIASGSLLPYVCCTLFRKYKLKEYLNIYQKPDLVRLRSFISKLTNDFEITQEGLWGIQLIREGKIFRADVFRSINPDVEDIKNEFFEIVDPIYKMNLNNK